MCFESLQAAKTLVFVCALGPLASACASNSTRTDRPERDGVTRDTVVTTQKHREVWRRTKSGWRLSRVKELGGTVMVNGKPF
jgi:hypothetical protein